MHRRHWILWPALIVTIILLGGRWGMPLGIPGEWTWERIEWTADNRADAFWGMLSAIIAGGLYVAFALWGAHQLRDHAGLRKSIHWLAGLWIVANGWIFALQSAPLTPYNLTRSGWVTYYPTISGYFFHARHRIDDLDSFLSGYERWMAEGDVLHVGTHPPGLYILNLACLRSCEASPLLTDLLILTTPPDVDRGLNEIAVHNRDPSQILRRPDRAALWGMILLTHGLSLAAIFPLYGLVRYHFPAQSAWRVVTLWPLVPALAVFLPKTDALYPLLTLTIIWASLQSIRRQSWIWGLVAGLLMWLGMLCSLAVLPAMLLNMLLILWELRYPYSTIPKTGVVVSFMDCAKRAYVPLATMATAFLLAVATMWWVFDLNLWNCWLLNYQNHSGFYAQYPRTYWKWLLVNPWELSLAVGLPVAVCLMHLLLRYRALLSKLPRNACGPFLFCPLVWGLLWLSGKNMGEAARLWIFLMPWVLWLLAGLWHLESAGEQTATALEKSSPVDLVNSPVVIEQNMFRQDYYWLLVTQMLAAVYTVTHVSGFHFLQF
ncbi:MAG: hypothetical protein ACKVT0_00300 [Planctomycetaceae bacterium]